MVNTEGKEAKHECIERSKDQIKGHTIDFSLYTLTVVVVVVAVVVVVVEVVCENGTRTKRRRHSKRHEKDQPR